jgi:hypothetical protein
MNTRPTAEKLATQVETFLGIQALKWNDPIGGFFDADLPDGWTVAIRLDNEQVRVVDPQCSNSLTLQEYTQWKNK